MTQQRLLKQRLAGMQEIGEIMSSMKNLAFMETRKLARLMRNQDRVVEQIEGTARDFLAFNPGLLPALATRRRVYLVIGSRRGFCGDFNARLAAALDAEPGISSGEDPVIAVGRKLCRSLEQYPGFRSGLDGGDVAEEIPQVLQALVRELGRHLPQQSAASLVVFYHRLQAQVPHRLQLLPPFTEAATRAAATEGYAPLLNLSPQAFLLGLVEQYLYASLHQVLYESLLAENESRMRHLEGATRHLEEQEESIRRRLHALRQEEITEEIEVILLNAAGLSEAASEKMS